MSWPEETRGPCLHFKGNQSVIMPWIPDICARPALAIHLCRWWLTSHRRHHIQFRLAIDLDSSWIKLAPLCSCRLYLQNHMIFAKVNGSFVAAQERLFAPKAVQLPTGIESQLLRSYRAQFTQTSTFQAVTYKWQCYPKQTRKSHIKHRDC